jgi:molybdenum cofactor biosynthesis enzyme MoaA
MAMIQSLAARLAAARDQRTESADHPADTATWPACRAPHTALRFSPTGVVRACCANDKVSLGKVGDISLREVWEGSPIRELALAIERGDYSQGCDDCAPGIIADREASPAANFDRFPRQPRSGWPLRLEFALSNRCNLECVMCNGELSSVIRVKREGRAPLPRAYGDDFYDEIVPFLRHAQETAFIGGEPFLEPGARRILDQLIALGRPGDVHVTTNGTIGGERVENYLQTLRMDVAVSIDAATKETFEAIRVGASFDEVIANRDRFLQITRANNRTLAVNFCLMTNNWHELHLMCLEADRIDVPLQVIPVFYPAEFSPMCLPDDEVAAIVERLEGIGADVRPELGRNREVWDSTVALLRDHVERAARNEIPVALRVRQITRTPPPRPAEALIELEAWSDWAPIQFDEADAPGAVELTAALERWLGPRTIIEAHAQTPDHDWTATFSVQSGPVTVRSALLAIDGPEGPQPAGIAVALDRDPSRLLPTEAAELLLCPSTAEAERRHQATVAALAAELETRSGRAPIRFDVTSGAIRESVLPGWLTHDSSAFESQPPHAIVLPGSDAVTVPRSLEAHAPLVTHGYGEIPVGGRGIGAEVFITQRLGSSDLTVLIAPDEAF